MFARCVYVCVHSPRHSVPQVMGCCLSFIKKARSVFVNAFINELQFVFGSVPELVA